MILGLITLAFIVVGTTLTYCRWDLSDAREGSLVEAISEWNQFSIASTHIDEHPHVQSK